MKAIREYLYKCGSCGATGWSSAGKPTVCEHPDVKVYRTIANRKVAVRGGDRVEVSGQPDMETR